MPGLERPADAAVQRPAVHAERRLAWKRLDSVERIDGRIAVREDVKKVLDSRGQRVPSNAASASTKMQAHTKRRLAACIGSPSCWGRPGVESRSYERPPSKIGNRGHLRQASRRREVKDR